MDIDTLKSDARWVIILVAIMGLIIALFIMFEQPMEVWVGESLNSMDQPVSVASVITLLLTLDVILPVPSSIVSVTASAMLGFVGGAISVWLGLTLGCVLGYWIGAKCNSVFLKRILGEKEFYRAEKLSQRFGVGMLVTMRAVPVLAETSVIAAGMIKFPLNKFFISTTLANTGVALAYAYIGGRATADNALMLIVIASLAVPLLGFAVFKFTHIINESRSLKLIHKRLFSKNSYNNTPSNKSLNANFRVEFSYNVNFTEGVFNSHNLDLLGSLTADKPTSKSKTLIYIDTGVLQTNLNLITEIDSYFEIHHEYLVLLAPAISVIGGESCKNSEEIERIYKTMLTSGIDRHCFIIAIGGGAVLDAVGFAAASFHRGVKVVRLPSTVLAQNDAGIGVKNGINAYKIKNLVGSFSPPHHIINDYKFISTLSCRDKRSGIAEAIKVASIRDREFFNWLEEHAEQLHDFEDEAMKYMIYRCAALHLKQISGGGDPFEKGQARPLDYGHWSAHKLETLVNYQLRHGEAVAIGMALDARYAVNVGLLSEHESLRMIELLENIGFDLWHPILEKENEHKELLFIEGLEEFRQHLGGELCITLLTSIGVAKEVNYMERKEIIEAKDWLREHCSCYELSKQNPGSKVSIY